MAEGYEDKTAFFVGEGVFCYGKMPFGLKNAGTTYQRLVDKVFNKQIERNLEAYIDDMVIKITSEEGILSPFLGHLITKQGIKANPSKIKAVTKLEQPRALKDIQSLNGKLAALSRFLSNRAERSLLFFKVLKSCKGKKKIHWTDEADKAFKEIKKFVEALPTLTTPRAGETLTMYLAASKESINVALFAKRSEGQIPIYFVSRVLQGAELNYPALEKLLVAFVHAARRLQRYFQAHTIMVLTDERETPADFLPEIPFDDSEKKVKEKEVSDPSNEWKLYTDRAFSSDGAGAGLMLIDPAGNGNHKISDIPRLATSGKPNKGDLRSKTVVNQKLLAEPRSMVVRIIKQGSYWPSMHKEAAKAIQDCDKCKEQSAIRKARADGAITVGSMWPFSHWGIHILGPLPMALGGL
ncbi:reverse transcriptase domain-containing protein [Tanacetum coccineum]|uniref:Reverse transcriptase domain-containing protein n=1 Tax=Tanacetum coccineum TaxID=301880 RepID=A0ABQ5EBS3_9ASTR